MIKRNFINEHIMLRMDARKQLNLTFLVHKVADNRKPKYLYEKLNWVSTFKNKALKNGYTLFYYQNIERQASEIFQMLSRKNMERHPSYFIPDNVLIVTDFATYFWNQRKKKVYLWYSSSLSWNSYVGHYIHSLNVYFTQLVVCILYQLLLLN